MHIINSAGIAYHQHEVLYIIRNLLRHIINAKHCISSARRDVCPQPAGLHGIHRRWHGINSKVVRLDTRFARCHARLRRNSIQRASALMTYQSFGLDKKIPRTMFSEFFWQGRSSSNRMPIFFEIDPWFSASGRRIPWR